MAVDGTPVGKLGLTICYDLRFPALFERLSEAGAQLVSVPAAFTVPTGKAHWEVLLRARAIEAGVFVVAAGGCEEAEPITPPRQLPGSPFHYPEELWDAGVEGETVLRLWVNPEGAVDSVEVDRTSDYPAFASAAVNGSSKSSRNNCWWRLMTRSLVMVGRAVADLPEPVVVTGDLNDVAWSRNNYLFQNISGLLDPRVGRGFYHTFHAKIPFLRFPLDHLFHSNHFRLVEFRRLGYFGSDHFPVFVKLCWEGDAEFNQDEPEPTPGELEDAVERAAYAEEASPNKEPEFVLNKPNS